MRACAPLAGAQAVPQQKCAVGVLGVVLGVTRVLLDSPLFFCWAIATCGVWFPPQGYQAEGGGDVRNTRLRDRETRDMSLSQHSRQHWVSPHPMLLVSSAPSTACGLANGKAGDDGLFRLGKGAFCVVLPLFLLQSGLLVRPQLGPEALHKRLHVNVHRALLAATRLGLQTRADPAVEWSEHKVTLKHTQWYRVFSDRYKARLIHGLDKS